MSASTTPFLDLKLLAAAQAQKHVTHNEALMALDAIVHLAVSNAALAAPPATPAEGDRAIIAVSATGAFAGHDRQVALYRDGGWNFFSPRAGWRAWCTASSQLLVFDGTQWQLTTPDPHSSSYFGINTSADTTNRLSVSADTTLLTHDGAGHQLKINKAAAAQTASLLMQDSYSGRAEIGLCGDDKLHIKTSANGSAWAEAMVIDPATGWIGIGGYTASSLAGASPAGATQFLDMGSSGFTALSVRSHSDGGNPSSVGARSRGSMAAPTIVQNADYLYSFFAQGYDGAAYKNAAAIRIMVDGTPASGSVPGKLSFQTTQAGAGSFTPRLEITSAGTTRPAADNAYSFGEAGSRWASVWSATGVIQTSDARLKTDISNSVLGLAFIERLRPVSYRWITGSNLVSSEDIPDGESRMVLTPKAGRRTHYGLIAQEVKTALSASGVDDFAGYIKALPADPDSEEGLRYDQFIAPLIKAVQELSARVAALETV